MAERRMFAKTIIDSDAFLDMPLSTQALYFHLSMRADDEGFVNNPKKIARMIGADDDSLKLLSVKNFIIPFESGIVVIKHWRIHNYIQKDRFKETVYQDERMLLDVKENGAYTQFSEPVKCLDTDCIHDVSILDTGCIQDVSSLETQVRLGKDRLGKDREEDTADKPQKRTRFVKPSIEEIFEYCRERGNSVDPQRFYDYYEANGWKVGKNTMKDWKAAVRTWERNGYDQKPQTQQLQRQPYPPAHSSIDMDEIQKLFGRLDD